MCFWSSWLRYTLFSVAKAWKANLKGVPSGASSGAQLSSPGRPPNLNQPTIKSTYIWGNFTVRSPPQKRKRLFSWPSSPSKLRKFPVYTARDAANKLNRTPLQCLHVYLYYTTEITEIAYS